MGRDGHGSRGVQLVHNVTLECGSTTASSIYHSLRLLFQNHALRHGNTWHITGCYSPCASPQIGYALHQALALLSPTGKFHTCARDGKPIALQARKQQLGSSKEKDKQSCRDKGVTTVGTTACQDDSAYGGRPTHAGNCCCNTSHNTYLNTSTWPSTRQQMCVPVWRACM
jgi:hypothetical protein